MEAGRALPARPFNAPWWRQRAFALDGDRASKAPTWRRRHGGRAGFARAAVQRTLLEERAFALEGDRASKIRPDGTGEDSERRRRRPPGDRKDLARRGDALPGRRDQPARD